MILSILSLIIALTIAFGRQVAVFGKVKQALWFFSNFETKRLVFTVIALTIGILGLLQYGSSNGILTIFILTFLAILFSFFFDMKYFFPEIKKVEKSSTIGIPLNTKIIGVNINKESVAYPLEEVVIPRHIINDKIGNTNVLISYCALCISALAFDSKVGNDNLYFKVAGVWRRNMIIYDTETYSLWQQATGECIYGKLKGSQLILLSGENTTLGEWKKKHPNTNFASKCIESRKGYMSRSLMLKGLNFITPKVTVPGFTDLKGLPERETVFGIEYNGVSKAYPLTEILDEYYFEDHYNGKVIDLHYNADANYLTAKVRESDTEIVVEKHWWLGWKEFHPETEIWKKST